MAFLKLYPLHETEHLGEQDFGRGHPARCIAIRQFDAREFYLNVDRIAAFEACPLYLICDAEPNGLVDGIRLRLVGGEILVVPDDPEDGQSGFVAALAQALREGVAEVGFSAYLRELARLGHI
ncbi:MAG TPA: hypothetical protein PLW81_03245 [Thiobacillaceae bacterium]|nr:hypothetical protein [Thiobacillaceae bacterium]